LIFFGFGFGRLRGLGVDRRRRLIDVAFGNRRGLIGIRIHLEARRRIIG